MKTINQTKIRINRTERRKNAIRSIVKSTLMICGSAIIFLYLEGCAPCYYAPSAQNVPILKESGQINGSAAIKFGQRTVGLDIQSAVAVTDHLGIMLNYSSYSAQEADLWDYYSIVYKSKLIEFGLGYYHPFHESFVFETYAGYGSDNIKTDYDQNNWSGNSKLHYSTFFLQPSIGFYKEHIELAFSARFRVLDYNKFTCNENNGGYLTQSLQEITDHPAACMIEPAFTMRVGGEHVKFQLQAGVSAFLNQKSQVNYDPINLNFGLIFGLKGKKSKSNDVAK